MPMAFLYAYPDIDPYPTTYVAHTIPEKGHHLHHVPLPYMVYKAHKMFHDKDQDLHQPRADLRETENAFYIEVELPGIREKSELRLRWTTLRSLLVKSSIHRPEIPETEHHGEAPSTAPEVTTATEPAKATEEAPPAGTATKPKEPVKIEPHLTVHERQIGDHIRAFNFPVDVDRDKTTARLEAGLLRIIVPKVEHERIEHVHVPVSDGEQAISAA